MPLRDILRKKNKIKDDPPSAAIQPPPEFRFIQTDAQNVETAQPPAFDDNDGGRSNRKSFGLLRRLSNNSSHELSPTHEKRERRLSNRLLGGSSRSRSTSSVNLPENLPSIQNHIDDDQEREAQWEKRATVLIQGNAHMGPQNPMGAAQRPRSPSVAPVNPQGDVNIQEAIRLHEAGDLSKSTEMFGKLADPNGENNALSQVLYGLALRHGWGCTPDTQRAITYLSAAASNSASIEADALHAGVKKGGAAKGELVLAIFELANCFRHGWGVSKDPVAARQYYETAANLGDTDAMNEAGWCFLEGFGGKKSRYTAAKYYRLAEKNGNKTLGNTWIWKDKYDPK